MILVLSYNYNGILFTFENVSIYMLYIMFIHVARVNGNLPANSLIPNCRACTHVHT